MKHRPTGNRHKALEIDAGVAKRGADGFRLHPWLVPPGSAGVPPAPYSCKQPAAAPLQTKPAFTGCSSIVPGFVRARRPRSRVVFVRARRPRSQVGYSFLVPDPWQTPLDFPPTP